MLIVYKETSSASISCRGVTCWPGTELNHRKSIIAAISTQSPVLSRPRAVSAAVTLRSFASQDFVI
jgi:hypothetical protein